MIELFFTNFNRYDGKMQCERIVVVHQLFSFVEASKGVCTGALTFS